MSGDETKRGVKVRVNVLEPCDTPDLGSCYSVDNKKCCLLFDKNAFSKWNSAGSLVWVVSTCCIGTNAEGSVTFNLDPPKIGSPRNEFF